MKLSQIAEKTGATLVGDGSAEILRVSTIERAGVGDLTFVANPRYNHFLKSTQATAIILSKAPETSRLNLLIHPDPYYAFSVVLTLFYPHPGSHLGSGIAASAVIAPTATIGANVHVGNFVEIGDGAVIGDGTKIMKGCSIGAGVKIGKECLLHPNVTVYDGCLLGNRVAIHSGTVIGSDGFGYAIHEGVHHKILQVGIVRIEDNVEIGSNCSIDRAALDETIIGEGTKIDNLVQIAHNVKIGRRCLIIAQVGISGSTVLGEYVTLAGQVGVVGHIEIGDRAIVIAQAGVPKSLEGGKIYAGSPAREFMEFKKTEAQIHRLPQRLEQLRKVEAELADLKKKLETTE
jgi:UDP-3-O-[3-hydroxymyristoyl] glucosamine N-acyltransferase